MQPADQAFITDAEEFLRSLRSILLVAAREDTAPGLRTHLHTLNKLSQNADKLGLSAVSLTLSALHDEAKQADGGRITGHDSSFRTLLDLLANAEAEIVKARFEPDDDPTDLLGLLDDRFGVGTVSPDPLPESVAAEAVNGIIDEFEIDPELLEIFSLEAEDLLNNIDTNLGNLTATPSDREALWEVRRHAHTFKGAAGIIGLKGPSQLAHRIEDLLDHLATAGAAPDGQLLELIGTATECMRVITSGDSSAATLRRVAEVYDRFEQAIPVEGKLGLDTSGKPLVPKIEIVQRDKPKGDIRDAQPALRPIVRVSIARLDELTTLARDLVISRTVIEQRIAEMDEHIEAFSRTTRRLQGINAKIENNFEASLLMTETPGFLAKDDSWIDERETSQPPARFDVLEFDRYTDFHETSRELSETAQDLFSICTSLESVKGTLETVFDEHRRLVDATQNKVRQIRLIKFGSLATRLERAVRVTSDETGTRAAVILVNEDVELDTDVLDSLVEPLMHLIRNAIAHGIESPETRRLIGKPETGRIEVGITNEETHIVLKVSDDGRGIIGPALKERAIASGLIERDAAEQLDLAAQNSLIFQPGLTTAEKITMSAGRGVGMSIVKESIETRGGSILVESAPQAGTTFTIRMPLSLAITQALLVRSAGHLAAIPMKAVRQTFDISQSQLLAGLSDGAIAVGTNRARLRVLSESFGPRTLVNFLAERYDVLIIETVGQLTALVVDEILKTEEIAIKPLGSPLDLLPGLLGAAVLGNGKIVPVLDVGDLPIVSITDDPSSKGSKEPARMPSVLIVDDSPSVRHTTMKIVKSAGWDAIAAKDGVEAIEMLESGDLPNIILTDVEMPRMDGYEFVSAIQNSEMLREIPIVFITSRISEKHRRSAAELGITEYVTKPFAEAELIETMERLCMEPAGAVT